LYRAAGIAEIEAGIGGGEIRGRAAGIGGFLGQGGGGLAIGFLAPMAGIVQGALKMQNGRLD